MTKEEKIQQIDQECEDIKQAADVFAVKKMAPMMLEQEIETLISDWQTRHPEWRIDTLSYDLEENEARVLLHETGKQPLFMQSIGGINADRN